MRRREFLAASAALASPAVAGCTGGDGDGGGSPVTVALVDFAFEPGTDEPIEVAAGTTIRFVWETGPHNIVVDAKPPASTWTGHEPVENAGFEHEHAFDVAGEYHFWCQPHRGIGMVGDLVVSADGGGADG